MAGQVQEGLASVQTVKKITPIPDAAVIECASVLGWEVVCRKGDFAPGQKVIYIETDALLPLDDSRFAFLAGENVKTVGGRQYRRLTSARMRGQISQGIVFSLDKFGFPEDIPVGTDVTAQLHLLKYEPPEEPVFMPSEKPQPVHKDFPSFPGLSKSAEIRIQSKPELIEEFIGREVYITVKIAGTSATYYSMANPDRRPGRAARAVNAVKWLFSKGIPARRESVCTRNQDIGLRPLHTSFDPYHIIEQQYGILRSIRRCGLNLAVQGEIYGEKIQGNPLGITGLEFAVFNIFDISHGSYMRYRELKQTCRLLNLPTVPVVFEGIFAWNSIDQLKMLSGGTYPNGRPREGIVIRRTDAAVGEGGSINSFKVVNDEYLLQDEQ